MAELLLESPLEGELIALKEVNDPAFASEAMGRGAAVKNPQGKVRAPFDGEVTVLFPTKHAIGLHSTAGVDLLVHVGLDTVNLEGKHFTAHVEQGAEIKKGDLLIEFDEAAIRAAGACGEGESRRLRHHLPRLPELVQRYADGGLYVPRNE